MSKSVRDQFSISQQWFGILSKSWQETLSQNYKLMCKNPANSERGGDITISFGMEWHRYS